MLKHKNIENLPANVQKNILPYLEKIIDALKDDIKSIFLYGSVSGGDYNPKTSDVNIGIVLKSVSMQKLKSVAGLVKSGLKHRITAPLFLTPEYINMSLDTFPVEFLEMKDSSVLLYGEDMLGGISVEREDIRRECEHQIKGKIVTIRQAYLEQALDKKGLEILIKKVFRSLMPILRNVLRLKMAENLPKDKEEILNKVGKEFGINVSSFIEMLKDKKSDGKIGGKSPEIFLEDFVRELEKLSEIIDRI